MIEGNAYLKKYSTLQLNYSFKTILIKIQIFFFIHIWSKMLSSSLDVLLKLSKTTSPQKLFDYDCKTLYLCKTKLLYSGLLDSAPDPEDVPVEKIVMDVDGTDLPFPDNSVDIGRHN